METSVSRFFLASSNETEVFTTDDNDDDDDEEADEEKERELATEERCDATEDGIKRVRVLRGSAANIVLARQGGAGGSLLNNSGGTDILRGGCDAITRGYGLKDVGKGVGLTPDFNRNRVTASSGVSME